MSADQRKDLPPAGSPGFLDAVREVLSVYLGKRGDPLNRGVTLRDLSDAGMVELSPGYLQRPGSRPPIVGPGPNVGSGGDGGGGGTIEPDLTPPPTPTGVVVSATFSALIMQHAAPIYTQGHGHARTKVYGAIRAAGASQPVFGDAVEITQFVGNIFSHPTTLGTTWHLWFKWVSQDGVESTVPAGGANGFVATTGRIGNADLGPLIVEAGNLAAAAVDLGSSKVTGTITDPARFGAVAVGYTVTQYLVATSGLLANLKVDDAQMVSVSADKLLAGSIQVGRHIQSADFVPGTSGWVIRGNGTAEFAAASIRGKITANQFDGRGVRIEDEAGNLILGAGNALPPAYIGATGANLVFNPSFDNGLSGWGYEGGYGIGRSSDGVNLNASYSPVGANCMWSYQAGRGGSPAYYYRYFSKNMAVEAGARYVLSAYSGAQGCTFSVFVQVYNSAGQLIADAQALSANASEAIGGNALAQFKRHFSAVDMPSGAAYCRVILNKGDTNAGNSGSYVFCTRVQFEKVAANVTSPSAWNDSGLLDSSTVRATNPITQSNASTYIANAAIGAAHIGSLNVDVLNTTMNGGSAAGLRIQSNKLMVFDGSNNEVVRVGYLL